MGTSTWHRSPETEEWRRVRELYAQPGVSPREVVARIVAALDPDTRAGMSAPAPVTCLGALVEGAQLVATRGMAATLDHLGVGREPAAVQMAAGLRDRAERIIADEGLASRFGDLALEAVGTTALAIATLHTAGAGIMEVPLSVAESNFARFHRDRRLHDIAALFTGHELDRSFRHFVARDVADFVGGEGLPTVSHANRLQDAVAARCREARKALRLDDYEDALVPTLTMAPAERVVRLQPVMAAGIDQGLAWLGAGGG